MSFLLSFCLMMFFLIHLDFAAAGKVIFKKEPVKSNGILMRMGQNSNLSKYFAGKMINLSSLNFLTH